MLSGEEIRALLAMLPDTVAIRVLELLASVPCRVYEAERLTLSVLPADRWEEGNAMIASLVRDRLRKDLS